MNWEKEFDKEFPFADVGQRCLQEPPNNKSLKSFIQSEIDKAREEERQEAFILNGQEGLAKLIRQSTLNEVVEIIEGMKMENLTTKERHERPGGWNKALDTLKERIEKL